MGFLVAEFSQRLSGERFTISTEIAQREIKAIPANMPPSKYFLSKNCPAPGKTSVDNNVALIVLFIIIASTNGHVNDCSNSQSCEAVFY
jgi:hypothetical protein